MQHEIRILKKIFEFALFLGWITFRTFYTDDLTKISKPGDREKEVLGNAPQCGSSLTVSCDVMSEGASPACSGPSPGTAGSGIVSVILLDETARVDVV